MIPPSADRHGWFKAIRSDDALDLIRRNKNAFVLLYIIASRARWRDGISVSGMTQGQAFVGDHDTIGLSEREYRTAKTILEKAALATFKPTTKGTIATLCANSVFDIGHELGDGRNDGQATDKRRAGDGQATTKEEGEERKEGDKERGGNAPPDEIDVIVTGFCKSIPKPYCRHYWQQRTIANAWVKNGQLINWEMDLADWWIRDGHAYVQKQHRAHPEYQAPHGNNQQPRNQRPDRNEGTANEGHADRYKGVADIPAPEGHHEVIDVPTATVLTAADRYRYDNELRRIENRLKEIENGAHHDPLQGPRYDAKQKTERQKLKPRAEELKTLLGYLT